MIKLTIIGAGSAVFTKRIVTDLTINRGTQKDGHRLDGY